jgi:hypothetical protein
VDVERRRLAESAQSQARWIESMARFEIMNTLRDSHEAELATLTQFFEAHAGYEVFAKTGETVLARREGDDIAFLMRHGTETLEADDRLPFDFKRAQPMHRALQGLSGTMIGIDHDGVLVLAAYEPVAVLDLGIVSKIDMAEVRAPFVRAGLLAVIISMGLVVAGAWLFVAISRPMIRDSRSTRGTWSDGPCAPGKRGALPAHLRAGGGRRRPRHPGRRFRAFQLEILRDHRLHGRRAEGNARPAALPS